MQISSREVLGRITGRMGSRTCTLLRAVLVFSLAISVVTGIVPETSASEAEDQPTFLRHFWSTSDKHHYKLSEGGEVAELVLDQKAGKLTATTELYCMLLGRVDGSFLVT